MNWRLRKIFVAVLLAVVLTVVLTGVVAAAPPWQGVADTLGINW